jgi:hypothetical protein
MSKTLRMTFNATVPILCIDLGVVTDKMQDVMSRQKFQIKHLVLNRTRPWYQSMVKYFGITIDRSL